MFESAKLAELKSVIEKEVSRLETRVEDIFKDGTLPDGSTPRIPASDGFFFAKEVLTTLRALAEAL